MSCRNDKEPTRRYHAGCCVKSVHEMGSMRSADLALIKSLCKHVLPTAWTEALSRSPWLKRWRNRWAGRVYCCRALQGESNYNICVNCDMTVSCHCRDYDASGHIGDLNAQSLDAIFSGETACRFRRRLARGKYAIAACPDCGDLRSIPKRDAARYLDSFHAPEQGIMVENTVLCNLNCIGCNSKQVAKTRRQVRMSLADITRVAEMLHTCAIREVTFHNLGEPFLSATVHEELSILRRLNPGITIVCSTNGLCIESETQRGAALMADHLYFSIDGPSQEVVTRYQVNGDFARAFANMRNLVSVRDDRGLAKPIIEWKYVVFRWNDEPRYVERAVELAREARIDQISFWLGGGLPSQVSRRFLHDPYFQQLGTASWKGREIILRQHSA